MPSFDPGDLSPQDTYFLLTSLVVPRPIAWVGSRSAGGVDNLAPHSYFNVISSDPPIVHFTSTGVKDTLTNVRQTGEFTISVVSAPLLEQMNRTAVDAPADVDEFQWAGVAKAESSVVAPPRVANAPAALECRVRTVLSMGSGHMVFGDVLRAHISDEVWIDGRVDVEKLEPVGRLSGSQYVVADHVTRRDRPRWAEVGEQR